MFPRSFPGSALVSAGALAAALVVAPGMAATAHAAAPVVAKPITYPNGAVEVPLDPQAQQNTNWCWAATGTSIAVYKGKNVNQNTFCNLAFNRATTSYCPNDQATLGNDQVAFRKLGITPGRYIDGVVNFNGVQTEIKGDRPILTRIEWTSGGGHMMVINGFRASDRTVQWYNPWPDDQRINVASYDYYVDNDDFFWTHSLYGIGA